MFPCLKAFGTGQEAAHRVYEILNRKPLIVNDPNGKKISNLEGNIELREVTFTYPSK